MTNKYHNKLLIHALFLFSVLSFQAQTKKELVKAVKIPVLIIDGFSNHQWATNTEYLKKILDATGKFVVSVSTCPNPKENKSEWENWNPKFATYPVVIQTCNNIMDYEGIQWPDSVKKAFENYVSNGGGVYMYHSANNAFKDWSAYNKMIGLGWRDKDFGVSASINIKEEIEIIPKGIGENSGHGKRTDAMLTRIGDHPIHQGMPKSWIAADVEVYKYLRGTIENVQVLSYAEGAMTTLNFPTEWVVKFGKGKVYCSVYGHLWKNQEWPPSMRCAAFQQTMVKVLQWLSGNRVDNKVDSNFPTSNTSVLMPIIEE
jgi:type 1 glutamine amidotransferase